MTSTKTTSENNCKFCGCKPGTYDTTCECNCHRPMPNKTPRDKNYFTLYDFRGEWASDEAKKEILKQINEKTETLLEEARQEMKEKCIKIVWEYNDYDNLSEKIENSIQSL